MFKILRLVRLICFKTAVSETNLTFSRSLNLRKAKPVQHAHFHVSILQTAALGGTGAYGRHHRINTTTKEGVSTIQRNGVTHKVHNLCCPFVALSKVAGPDSSVG